MVIPKGKLGQGAWSYQKGHKDTGTLLIQKGHDKDKGACAYQKGHYKDLRHGCQKGH